MITGKFLVQWFIILWIGLSFGSAVARAGDNWSPLVAELRGIRTELTQIRQALQRR